MACGRDLLSWGVLSRALSYMTSMRAPKGTYMPFIISIVRLLPIMASLACKQSNSRYEKSEIYQEVGTANQVPNYYHS